MLDDVVLARVDEIKGAILAHDGLERVGERVCDGAAHVEGDHEGCLEAGEGDVFAISRSVFGQLSKRGGGLGSVNAQVPLVCQRVQAGTRCAIGDVQPDVGMVFAADLGSFGFSLFGVESEDALDGVGYGKIHFDGLL